ncbi:MAG: sulfatase [Acidobacteriota bacterium]
MRASVPFRLLLALGAAGGFVVTPAATPRPAVPVVNNAILVTISGLRADRIGTDHPGATLTPEFDRLATGGALFTHGRTPAPVTLPALVSLMTGFDPHKHRILEASNVGPDLATLATRLAGQGRTTLAVVPDEALANVSLLSAGFERVLSLPGATAPQLARRAAALTRKLPAETPFFLWIHLADCAAPLTPDLDDLLQASPAHVGSVRDLTLAPGERDSLPGILPTDVHNGPLRSTGYYLAAYDAGVIRADRGLGIIRAALEESGRQADTLLVVASVHGTPLGEHGFWFTHGQSLYEEELRVPILFFNAPRSRPLRFDTPISLLDVLPTILGVLGSPGLRTDGLDLAGRLNGRFPLPQRNHYATQVVAPFARAVRAAGRFKLIFTPPPPPQVDGQEWWPDAVRRELYDMVEDPTESRSIERRRMAIANELLLQLQDRYPALPGTPPAEDRSRHR